MARINWGQVGEKRYEVGLDRGVLYPQSGNGVSWNGLISIDKTIDGATYKPYYLDGVKIFDEVERGNASFTMSAFSAPTEFLPCIGIKSLTLGLYATGQPRLPFGVSYRTGLGNDSEGLSHGYKIHVINEVLASSTSIKNSTMGKNTAPVVYKWDLSVLPKYTSSSKPISHVIIDTTRHSPSSITAIENILYGTLITPPRLPTLLELADFMEI